jgi:hypothetical protein
MTIFDLLDKLLLKYLYVLIALVGGLLYLFQMHVQRLGIALDLFDTLDDLLLEDLLTLFHLMHLAVEGLVFRGGRGAACVLGGGRLQGASRTLKGCAAFAH